VRVRVRIGFGLEEGLFERWDWKAFKIKESTTSLSTAVDRCALVVYTWTALFSPKYIMSDEVAEAASVSSASIALRLEKNPFSFIKALANIGVQLAIGKFNENAYAKAMPLTDSDLRLTTLRGSGESGEKRSK